MSTTVKIEPTVCPRTDADLLAAASHGDRAAVDELARRYVDLVYATATRLTRDRHAAEDVTQGVFLVLARKAGQVRGPALAAWLHRTTCYAAANARRVAARRQRHERAAARPEITMATEPGGAADPLLDDLDRAIGSLGEADRRAVVERYLLGRTPSEVARSLGTTPKAAQKRLERAVGRLRAYLARRGGPTPAGVTVTTLAVTAVLAAAGPSPATAAPPLSTAGPAAAAVADRVIAASALAKAKAAAAVVALLAVLAVVGFGGIRRWYRAAEPPVVDAAATADFQPPGPVVDPIGTLGSGSVVQLIGVSAPSVMAWWRSDGSPLEQPPYWGPAPEFFRTVPTAAVGSGRVVRSFGFAFESLPASAGVVVTTTGGDGETSDEVVDRHGRDVPATADAVLDLPDAPATIRFNLATGTWRAALETPASGGVDLLPVGSREIGPARDGGRAFKATGLAVDTTTTVQVTTTATGVIDGQTRLVAVDRGGGEHVGCSMNVDVDRAGRTVRRETFRFADLRPGDVVTLRLDSRPFDRWVEFRGVSLHANQRSRITVATSDGAK